MSGSEEPLADLVVEILETEHAVAITTGIFRQRLENQYGIEREYGELLEFLDQLVAEGVLEYNHGEYGEYTLPE